jgi:ATP-dependent exoDNAse (exonuclease V) beta subunit
VVTPGKLFVVGDPKQAIYGFRRADVATYERVKRHLIDGGASLLYLTTSFRAGPTIQSVVNRAFSAHMQAQRANTESAGGQADYVPLAPHRPDPTERPSVVALPVPDVLTEYGAVSKAKIRQHTPGVVASFVRWLVEESGWTVTDPAAGREVPVETRHVCLLFRRVRSYGNDVTEPYIRALEARRIAHVMVGGSSFHQREEVIAIRSALQAVEWPDDELMVYAALHGPFFALDDADLLAFRSQVGRLHPLVPIADVHRETCPAVAGALEVLRDLHYRRNRVPIADTVSQLLERTRAHAAIAYWTSGEQALANVLRIVDDAHRFEVRAGTSFRLFLDWLDDQATRGRDRQAPVVEEGSEGVRLMTVHSAKGLEFPVVVLCDPTVPRLNTKPSHHVDHARGLWAESIVGCAPLELLEHAAEVCAADDAEEIRVTYVAATRARDLLVVPAIEDARAAGWVDVLHDALYRPRAAEAGKVVWWSAPSGLGRAARARPGVWRTKLLAAAERSAEGIEVYRAWAEHRTVVRARAARPSLVARTVTAMSEEGKVGAAIDVQRTDAQRSGRPRGKRFGTLVHAILGELDLAAPEVEAMAHIQGRLLGAPASEIDAAIDAVHRALAHPLLARAKASSDCRRETPIVHRAANGTLVEGVVDLAFLDDDRWIVVDFKTDERGDDEKYAAQVRYYTEAISAATGCDATGVLFLV